MQLEFFVAYKFQFKALQFYLILQIKINLMAVKLHGFGQAKFSYGGSILGSTQIALLSQLPLKTKLDLKVVKIASKKII